jgi:hypothetical protein
MVMIVVQDATEASVAISRVRSELKTNVSESHSASTIVHGL